jgi:integrase
MAILTDTKARNAKPQAKSYKLQDGLGLFLEVRPSGAKTWRYRYWIDGKDGIFTIGDYPGVTLAEARKGREWAREQAKLGLNPTQVKATEKASRMSAAATTFEVVAKEWIEHSHGSWSLAYKMNIENVMFKDAYPVIGAIPIRSVEAIHLLKVIRAIEKRGAPSVAVLFRLWAGQLFRYAIIEQYVTGDPSVALKGAIKRKQVRHNPPLTQDDIPKFVAKIEVNGGWPPMRIAMKLMLLTFLRTQELRMGEWSEIDFAAAEWRIPSARMKMAKYMLPGEVHIVPLSHQALALLRELQKLTGNRAHLFPNIRNPKDCMSRTAINRAIERMGYGGEFSGHGFRSTASTFLHEQGWNENAIERQLAHAERDKVKASYNHAEYLPVRREMMQAWADWIDGLITASKSPG